MKKNTVSILFFSLLFSSSFIIEAKDKKTKATKVRKGAKRVKIKKGKKSTSPAKQKIVEKKTDEIITLLIEIGKIPELSEDKKIQSILEEIANDVASGYRIKSNTKDLETKKEDFPLIEKLLTKIETYNFTMFQISKEKNEENTRELMSKENSKIVSLKAKATELIAEILKEKLDNLTKSKLENILNLILSDKKVDYEEAKKYFNTKFKDIQNTQAIDLLATIRDYNRQIMIKKDPTLKDLIQSQADINKRIEEKNEKNKNEKRFIAHKELEDKTLILDKISKIITELEENKDYEKIKKEFTTLQEDIVNKTKEMKKGKKLIKYEEIMKKFLAIYTKINTAARKEGIDTKDINIQLNKIKDLLNQFKKEIDLFNKEIDLFNKENENILQPKIKEDMKKVFEEIKARPEKIRLLESNRSFKEIEKIIENKKLKEEKNKIIENINNIKDTAMLKTLEEIFQAVKSQETEGITNYLKSIWKNPDITKEDIDSFLQEIKKAIDNNKKD